MREECRRLCLMIVLALLAVVSCKPRNHETRESQQTPGPSPAEVAAIRDTLTRGMEPVAFDRLATGHIGRQCVVTARAAEDGTGRDQAPPPLGMVRKFGPTAIYKGELQEVSPNALKIRAAYPTSGRYKIIEVARSDIQSIHVAKSSSE